MENPYKTFGDILPGSIHRSRQGVYLRSIRAFTAAVMMIPGAASALSLDEALVIAREQATTLQTLEAETRQAEAQHTRTAQAFLPTLSADTSWLRADSSLITGVPVPDQTSPTGLRQADLGPVEGAVTGVQLVQPVFNADALKQREAASLKLDARRQARQWGQQALRLEVARRYFNILRLRSRQNAAEQASDAARQAVQMAEGSYQQGMAARLDVEQARAELAAAQARISQAEAAAREAEYQLKSLLGMAPREPLTLETGLPQPAPPMESGQGAPRKDLEARQLAARAADQQTRATEAEWLPRVNLLARQQWAHGNELLDDNADGWLVAVNLQWTLFDGLGRQGRIAEARAAADKIRTELEETRRRIDREQAIAASQWQAGFSAWQAAGKSVKAAEKAARLASRRYQENLGSMTDLLTARARLDRERATLIDSRYQAVLAAMNHHLQHGRDPLLALGNDYQ
ncbi:Outer membrane protein TolC [Marinobacter persicus]|uniref:Outer membrane protein TolC n=2 Tax=Marinobacter persicus TaxID=930118 RepID=A0A1I3XNA1_9GAMM|nr:Outer membrane protein TolC [Marinobacter persicus]